MAIILPSWFSTGNKNNMSMVPVPFTFAFFSKKLTKSITLHVLRTILTVRRDWNHVVQSNSVIYRILNWQVICVGDI